MIGAATDVGEAPVRPFLDFNNAADAWPSVHHDKDELRARLLDQLDAVLSYLFPHGKRQGSRFVIGNLQGAPGDSLVVELEGAKRGVWIDFATGEAGDVLALWAAVRGFAQRSAFGELLDDICTWLAVPRVPTIPAKSGVALDVLGAPSAKWDYLSADGQLLACVYRYDTPGGKEYRPWDARARATRMPDPRPLYNLPSVIATDAVVLVEGEKCVDALTRVGIVATTAMGGAATAIDKTDWSPLAGKIVAVWPDHDDAGAKYADAVIPKLQGLGAQVRRVTAPVEKHKKWDAADAVGEGMNISAFLAAAVPVAQAPSRQIADWHAVERFTGEPRQRQWLVEGVIPLAQASLIAAAGGVGKSFLLLSLAREVAAHDGSWLNATRLFGGSVSAQGIAVYLTAEDDAIEIHNRLNALGPIPPRLYVVPLPDAGGAIPLFAPNPATKAATTTPAWTDLEHQLLAMTRLKLVVFDPLQPLCALDLNVPENAQFVCSRLAALAAITGASVMVSHHFAKREAWTPEQAREAIRGTGGLVDGVRAVYALWQARNEDAKAVLKALHLPFQRGAVVFGGVVKANGRANLKVVTFVRDNRGLLCDRTADLQRTKTTTDDLLPQLKQAIAGAALDGKPYTKTGINGVYERRFEMPEAFHTIGKHTLVAMVETLLASESIVQAMADGSKSVKWLDVPDGELAQGDPSFSAGFIKRHGGQLEQREGASNDD